MALTGMQIYKNLPKTNCKDCGLPTCMAFAMQVAAKQRALTDCPHISAEAEAALSEAAAPPMQLIKIGPEDNHFELGQETVMFRHEEKFHRKTGIAVRLSANLSDAEALSRVEKINSSVFSRVGDCLKIDFCAVEVDGVADPANRLKQIAEKSNVPLIIMGKDSGALKAAVEEVKAQKPLIYRADNTNIDEYVKLACSAKVPLAITGSTLEELADLTSKAKDNGLSEIILSFNGKDIGQALRNLTISRRAALKRNYKPLGFPAMVEIEAETAEMETLMASIGRQICRNSLN